MLAHAPSPPGPHRGDRAPDRSLDSPTTRARRSRKTQRRAISCTIGTRRWRGPGHGPGLGIEDVRTAPRAPWQNAYVERVIGSVRRECLDHMIIVSEAGLRRVLPVRGLLRTVPHASVAEQGRADPTPERRTRRRSSRRNPAGGRASSPVRTTGGLTSRPNSLSQPESPIERRPVDAQDRSPNAADAASRRCSRPRRRASVTILKKPPAGFGPAEPHPSVRSLSPSPPLQNSTRWTFW